MYKKNVKKPENDNKFCVLSLISGNPIKCVEDQCWFYNNQPQKKKSSCILRDFFAYKIVEYYNKRYFEESMQKKDQELDNSRMY